MPDFYPISLQNYFLQLGLVRKYSELGILTGGFKPLSELKSEIVRSECQIFEIESGGEKKLLRAAKILGLDVLCKRRGRLLVLKEVLQINHLTGEKRYRSHYQITSLTEKLFVNEIPASALKRTLLEELGIQSIEHAGFIDTEQNEIETQTYRGLICKYLLLKYFVFIDQIDYKPNKLHFDDPYFPNEEFAYAQVQANKSTYFKWVNF